MNNNLDLLNKKKKELESNKKSLSDELISVQEQIDGIEKEQGMANINVIKPDVDSLLKYAKHVPGCYCRGDAYRFDSSDGDKCVRCFLLRIKNNTLAEDDYRFTIELNLDWRFT